MPRRVHVKKPFVKFDQDLDLIVNTYFHERNGFGIHKPTAVRLFQAVVDILDELKLNYFLISGTLLGCVRHGDFIPWDDDIDLLVEEAAFERLAKKASKYPNVTFFQRPDWGFMKVCLANGTEIETETEWKKHALTDGKYCWPFIDLFKYSVEGDKLSFFRKGWPDFEFLPGKKHLFLGRQVTLPCNPDYFLTKNYGKDYMTKLQSSSFCHRQEQGTDERNSINILDFKSRIKYGVDVKILQYEEYAQERCEDPIDLKQLIETHLVKKPSDGAHCVMINLEKDKDRYRNSVKELSKLAVTDFCHLKGTYWKNKSDLEQDLTFVLDFLRQFNPNIPETPLAIDDFSEVNDANIEIQGGPLGCFCSHLRAMIYGYLNFQDYTIIVEDDAVVTNTKKIEQYLACIPDDWDIVCLNACAKKTIYDQPWYRFKDEWHSTHFYIINHRCLPYLFARFYPIIDQVDVMISDQTQQLNIYNIPDTVYQKNLVTNTQNNLHVIFNSPNYEVIRLTLKRIENGLTYFIDKKLPKNKSRNAFLVAKLMYDVLYDYILRPEQESPTPDREDYVFDDSEFRGLKYDQLVEAIEYFLKCAKKGINTVEAAKGNLNCMLFTINQFASHGQADEDYLEPLKAYDYGAAGHVYLLEKRGIIVKKYHDKLRWTTVGHEKPRDIYDKELAILQLKLPHVPKLLAFDPERMTLKMEYGGLSLYDEFNLPGDWKDQLRNIFAEFDKRRVYYPEFYLQNILVREGRISFVDFGLAELDSDKTNEDNCLRFITLLETLNEKFKEVVDPAQRRELYCTFLKNLEHQQA